MENTNKPQWLIDAENEIKNFEESKYGKMTEKEFNLKDQFEYFTKLGRNKYKNDPRSKENAKAMGSIQGKKNIESGHMQRMRDKNDGTGGKNSGNIIRCCNRCTKKLKGNAAMSMHANYHKSFDQIYSLIHDSFSIMKLKKLLIKELLYSDSIAFRKAQVFAKDSYYCTKIHKGTTGSMYDVALYQKNETLL
jgi:hypothetical protein